MSGLWRGDCLGCLGMLGDDGTRSMYLGVVVETMRAASMELDDTFSFLFQQERDFVRLLEVDCLILFGSWFMMFMFLC